MSESPPDLRQLLSRLLDGKLSDTEQQQLNDLVRNDPSAQSKYREIMSLHALLYLDFIEGYRNLIPPLVGKEPPQFVGAPSLLASSLDTVASEKASDASTESARVSTNEGPDSNANGNSWRRRIAIASALLAASVMIMIAGIWWTYEKGFSEAERIATQSQNRQSIAQDQPPLNASPARSIAVLGQAAAAQWSSASSIPGVGGGLAAGAFELESGLVQLEFLSGAAVVIEGPAAFELISDSRLVCHRGKLRAHVPAQAHGFRIETPTMAAVDLGTEFTVDVARDGQSDFHVLDGEVELWDLDASGNVPAQTLTTGLSARATADGQLFQLALDQSPVVGARQLLELSEIAQQRRYADWRRFSDKLRSRSDVLVYYGFNQHDAWERELRNEGPDANESLTGAIVGCQWTTGRWTGKQALEFKRITDRVRLNVPGEFESLTYSAWVRVEGLERWLTSIMLTDGHDANEVHWQITEQGALLLGVNDDQGNLHDYFSPRILGPSDLGRWVHLAAVIDGKLGVVRHYLDGKQLSSESIKSVPTKSPAHLRIGKAEIGNWAPNDRPGYRTRSLNGRIDEFILFSSPLSSEEIRKIYEAGNPSS